MASVPEMYTLIIFYSLNEINYWSKETKSVPKVEATLYILHMA